MAEGRVSMLSLEEAATFAEQHGVGAQLASLNVFRMLLRRPRAAKALADVLLELLAGRALDHRLRELVIMRIGWVTGSEYEWAQHWTIATNLFGVAAEDLVAVRDWERSDRFAPTERAVLAATDEALTSDSMSADTVARCRNASLDDDALVELVLAIGVWRAVALLTRSLEIPVETGVEPWPPDHVAPS